MKDYANKRINANQLIGLTTLVGKLHFSEESYSFVAQSVNSDVICHIIEYKTIESVSERNTLGFIPTGISVKTTNGSIYNYVVFGRKEVIEFLRFKADCHKG